MARRSATTNSERITVLAAAVMAHVLLFTLLVWLSTSSPLIPPRSGSMSLISIIPQAAQGKPPPPVLPSKVADPNRIIPSDSFSADLDPTPLGASGGCAIFDLVSKSLTAEPTIAAALLTTPQESRSIADAVVIWNAGWSNVARAPDDPLGPARASIEQSLRSVPDNCLDEPVAGPRLVAIPEGERTMFLAIGSGTWTWRQLLAESDPSLPPTPSDDQAASLSWTWF